MKTIRAIGWDWTTDGAVLTVMVDDSLVQWFVPLMHVQVQFGREMGRVGCPLLPTVAGPPSVGGFFDSIGKAYKSATRVVKKALPKAVQKAVRSVERTAESGAKAISRKVKSYGRDIGRVAQSAVRDPRQLALAALTGGASLAAQTGLHRDVLGLAQHVPGPIGSAAAAGLAGGEALSNIAQGRRVDLGKLAGGLARAGAAYLPGGALAQGALPALEAGLAIAKGQRVDRALKNTLMKEATRGLKGLPLPSVPALAQAAQAWQKVSDVGRLARSAGALHPGDVARLAQGRKGLTAIRRTIAQARGGNPRARELVSAFQRVGACL